MGFFENFAWDFLAKKGRFLMKKHPFFSKFIYRPFRTKHPTADGFEIHYKEGGVYRIGEKIFFSSHSQIIGKNHNHFSYASISA